MSKRRLTGALQMSIWSNEYTTTYRYHQNVNMVKYDDLREPLKSEYDQMSIRRITGPFKSHSGQMSIRRPTGILKKSHFLSFCSSFLFVSRMPLLYSVYFKDNVYVLLCNLVYFFTNTICKCID